jgi:hypothetical protein
MLHDLFHALGAVSIDAPNHHLSGHVSDSNTDLMYSGSEPWYPSVLDYGNDDYYRHENSNITDIEDSSFLTTNHTIVYSSTTTSTSPTTTTTTTLSTTTTTTSKSTNFIVPIVYISIGLIFMKRKKLGRNR